MVGRPSAGPAPERRSWCSGLPVGQPAGQGPSMPVCVGPPHLVAAHMAALKASSQPSASHPPPRDAHLPVSRLLPATPNQAGEPDMLALPVNLVSHK